MKKAFIFLWIIITGCSISLAQNTSDSVVISDLVQKQIAEIRAKQTPQNQPAVVEKTQHAAKVNQAGTLIPESMYVALFAVLEIGFVGFFIWRFFLRRQQNKRPVQLMPIPIQTGRPRKHYSKAESLKLRTNATCKLTLLKTKEEITRHARDLQVGTGEVELAVRLQNMSEGNK